MQNVLSENPEIARKILELIPLPLFIKNSKEKLIYINKEEASFLGINLEEISSQDMIHWLKNDLSVILENKIIERIYRIKDRYFKVIKYPFTFEDESYIVGIAVDIPEVKRSLENLIVYKHVLDNLQEGVLLAINNPEKDYPVVYVNQNFADITGYSQEEILGKNCRFLAGSSPDPEERKVIKNSLEKLIPFEGIVTNYKKNGEKFKNHFRLLPLKNPQGKVNLFLGLQRDVTQNEEILREEKVYKSLINSHQDLILKWAKNGDIIFANQVFLEFFNISKEQILKRKSPFTTLDLQLNQQTPIRKKKLKHKDHWIDWTHEAIFDQNNLLVEVQSIGRDITQVIKDQESIVLNKNIYKALFENSTNFLVLIDTQGRVIECNKSSSQFGINTEDTIWESDCWNSSFENFRLFKLTLKEEVIDSGKNIKQAFYLIDLENKIHTYDFNFTPIYSNPKVLKYVLLEGTWNEKFSPKLTGKSLLEFNTPEDGPWALKWIAELWNYSLGLPRRMQKIILVLAIVAGGISGTFYLNKYNRELQDLVIQKEIENAQELVSEDPWSWAVLKLDPEVYTEERKERVNKVLTGLREQTSSSRSVMRAFLPPHNRFGLLLIDNISQGGFSPSDKIPLNLWIVDMQADNYSTLIPGFEKGQMVKRQYTIEGKGTYVVYSLSGGKTNKYYISVDYSPGITPPSKEVEEEIKKLMEIAIEKINSIMDW